MKSKLLIVIILNLLFSCKSERERKIEEIKSESTKTINSAVEDINSRGHKINADSLLKIFYKISKDSVELGLEFANQVRARVDSLNYIVTRAYDSVNHVAQVKADKENALLKAKKDKEDALIQKKWDNSKIGRIQKKHPDWPEEVCQRIAEHQIWIGMSIQMLIYERGNPNSANPSNYDDGVNWQWCWDDYTPSCFYGDNNGIITAYN